MFFFAETETIPKYSTLELSCQITPRLLETKDVDSGQRGRFDDGCHALMKGIPLNIDILVRAFNDAVLDQSNTHNSRGSSAFWLGLKNITGELKIIFRGYFRG